MSDRPSLDTRRAGAELAGLQRGRDPTFIRHVYDLHAIRTHYDPVEVAALAREVMLADAISRGHEFPAYGADPLAETLRTVAGIAGSVEYAGDYAVLQWDMLYGVRADFGEAMATLQLLASRLTGQEAR